MNLIYAGANDPSESYIFLTLKITKIFSLKKVLKLFVFQSMENDFHFVKFVKLFSN